MLLVNAIGNEFFKKIYFSFDLSSSQVYLIINCLSNINFSTQTLICFVKFGFLLILMLVLINFIIIILSLMIF